MQFLMFKGFSTVVKFISYLSFILLRPEETDNIKQDKGVGAKKARCPLTEDVSSSKINSSISKESHADNFDSEDLWTESTVEAGEGSESAQKSEVTLSQCEDEVDDAYPTPRLPYPCLSGLSIKEHRLYLNILKSKKQIAPPQVHSLS